MKRYTRTLLSMLLAVVMLANIGAAFAQDAQENPLAFEKYEPEIDVHIGRATENAIKFIEGESWDNNIWIDSYKERLGINIVNDFIVDTTQWDAKVNLVIASGDLPDILYVSAKQAKMLAEADLIQDLTDVFEKYASTMTASMLPHDSQTWNASMIDGKLMGLPMLWSLVYQLPVVWVRADWMTKLNAQEPKTVDELIALAELFATKDPDGNGQNDTYGIAIQKNLKGNVGDARGLLNMFGAYKDIWVKGEDGKLVNSSTLPSMRAALEKMADLYKRGIIDKEFGVKDEGKVVEDVVSEKVGILVGQFWNPAWPFMDLKTKNPDSDWIALRLLGEKEGEYALSQVTLKVDNFYVVRKECEHPEAVIKIANVDFDNLYGPSSSLWAETAMNDTYRDIQTFKYAVLGFEFPDANSEMYRQMQRAIKEGNGDSITLQIVKDEYETVLKWINDKNPDAWAAYKVRVDPQCGMAVVDAIITEDTIVYNEFYGLPGPVAIERAATMSKLEDEVFTKIIMGSAPIEDFDKFVEQWNQIGGVELTAEVNAWYDELSK